MGGKITSIVRSTLITSWVIAAGAFVSTGPAMADGIPATWNPDPNFPDFYQKDPKVNNGDCACAAVAATDSLFWLAQKYDLPKLATFGGATWQDVTNTLQSDTYMNTNAGDGTYSGSFASGKEQYIEDAGYGSRVRQEAMLGGDGSPPTIDWIKEQVAAGQDVEILVGGITNNGDNPASWDGGHYVAVTGYNADQLLIADPWTNNNNNGEALPISEPVDTILDFDANGNAKPAYTQTYAEVELQDGLNTDWGAQYDIVFAAVAESPVPEPSTWVMMLAGFAGLGFAGRRFSRKRIAVA